MTDEVIVFVIGFIATLITVVTPIVKLNTTITRLNTTIEAMQKAMDEQNTNFKARIDKQGAEIDELKKQAARHDMFIENHK